MRQGGHGLTFEEAKQERLRRIGESKKAETNEREKKEDAKNLERTRKREEKKEKKMVDEIKEEPVAYQEGGHLQSKEEIKAEAVAEIVAALALVGKYPELVKLLGGGDER